MPQPFVEVNVRAAFHLTQQCLKWMKEGDVINLLDIGGTRQAWPNAAAYCMSKAALHAMTECLAVELAPDVRVNAVALGMIGASTQADPNQWEKLQNRIPLKRFGRPEEVAEAVLFLLTGPSFVTGHTLVLDGGDLSRYRATRDDVFGESGYNEVIKRRFSTWKRLLKPMSLPPRTL